MRAGFASPLLFVAAAGLLAACPDRSISEVNPAQGRVEPKDIPIKVNRDLDLLFLIDNSPSMNDKQLNLIANFGTFIDVLSSIPGGLPNVHIGVATSDLGAKGADDAAPGNSIGTKGQGGCSNAGDAGRLQLLGGVTTTDNLPYLTDIQPEDPTAARVRNYTGSLNNTFTKIAHVGAGGCGFEQHLEGVKQALQQSLDTTSPNAGFLRKDAFLAVIIIADEDDCSMSHSTLLAPDNAMGLGSRQSFRCTRFGVLCDKDGADTDAMNVVGDKSLCHPNDNSAYLTKVSGYADFLKGLKDDPNKVIVAGIIGTTSPFTVETRPPTAGTTPVPALKHSCNYTGGDGKLEVADPPIRTKAFLDQFPNRNTFASICQQDLSGGLQQIADLLKAAIGDPCIQGKLANAPKYDCSVSAVVNQGAANAMETVLARCDATSSNAPCWHILTDAAQCPAKDSDHLVLKIEGQDKLATDTHIIANCVTLVTDAATDAGSP